MSRHYSDDQIQIFKNLPKRITNPKAHWSLKPSQNPLHRQRIFKAKGTMEDGLEHRFIIYLRESLRDNLSYSCGIAYHQIGAPNLTLARYNGPSHRHGNISYKTHIHRATEAAISAGMRPEHGAEETTRYTSLEGAFACLIDDFCISGVYAKPEQMNLFNGTQS